MFITTEKLSHKKQKTGKKYQKQKRQSMYNGKGNEKRMYIKLKNKNNI